MRSCARADHSFAGLIQGTESAQLRLRDHRVVEAGLPLNLARGIDPRGNFGARQCTVFTAQFFVRNCGNLGVHVDAVEQRIADLAGVTLNLRASATAIVGSVTVESAAASVQITTGMSMNLACRRVDGA